MTARDVATLWLVLSLALVAVVGLTAYVWEATKHADEVPK